MTAPGTGRIREVQRRLRAEQGEFVPKPVLPVIDEVVATVLSQHTSDTNSERAFAQLKASFSSWERVAAAPVGQVADATTFVPIDRPDTVVNAVRDVLATSHA